MALAVRIIPVILERRGAQVKGTRFAAWRSIGNAVQAARVHAQRGVDEVVYLNIGATPLNLPLDTGKIEKMTEGLFSPITVGGGIRTTEDVRAALAAGADKVAITTAAFDTPGLVQRAAERFGSQAITVGIDVDGRQVVTRCGTLKRNALDIDYAKRMVDEGAGEILLTAIHRDGTMAGYDLPLIERVARAVPVPVVAAGGCSSYDDMAAAIRAGASAVAAGALFAFTDATPAAAALHLAGLGIDVRI